MRFHRKKPQDQLSIKRVGLFVPKRITDDIEAAAPIAQRLVREHFGRRPLGAVEFVVTKTNLLSGLVAQSVAVAAGIKQDVWRDKVLSLTDRPGDIYAVTVVGPQTSIRIVLNAQRLRRRKGQEVGPTLVYAMVEVDQLCRKGGTEAQIALAHHEMGTHELTKPAAKKPYKKLAAGEVEAEEVTKQIMGKVVRNHRREEAEAQRQMPATAVGRA
ncbi:hypothetical protein QFZ56_000047 [Streptomyces achromogenes]|uniref:Uncharacterized protein n=1 Tax=Streptomyces achromogenes TaxID=67255 RepID=A0ABU0PRT6_STRAH|nr:hypothetical protein [Streptomyces achromogenes]MDQ0681084.1 hypothetical protein [Streptomyces achromogenes]